MVRSLLLGALALVVLGGCKNDDAKDEPTTTPTTTATTDDDTADAEDGANADNVDTDAQLLTSSLVTSSATGGLGLASESPDDLTTQDIGSNVDALFLPRKCVTASGTDSHALYTFSGCAGPNGLLSISGTVAIDYTVKVDSLDLSLTLNLTKLNGATLSGQATTTISATGASRSMTWSAQLQGTTASGKDFTRQSDHALSWNVGDKCIALSGTSDGSIGAREIKTQIENYDRCGRGCPEAGGKIIITNVARNRTIELDYDGTATAVYTNANGKQTSVPLLCKA